MPPPTGWSWSPPSPRVSSGCRTGLSPNARPTTSNFAPRWASVTALAPPAWRARVEAAAQAGWRLAQTEFRHVRFETDAAGQPRHSVFYFSAHLTNLMSAERVILEGDLGVDWASAPADGQSAAVKRVDASRIGLRSRRGDPPLPLLFVAEVVPPRERFPIDPLILHDLDGDGRSEILLPAVNLVYSRDAGGGSPTSVVAGTTSPDHRRAGGGRQHRRHGRSVGGGRRGACALPGAVHGPADSARPKSGSGAHPSRWRIRWP